MSTPTDDRIARLPRWAREYIEGLEHRIDTDGEIDISAGAVNLVTLTKAEQKQERWTQYSMSVAEWRRAYRAVK